MCDFCTILWQCTIYFILFFYISSCPSNSIKVIFTSDLLFFSRTKSDLIVLALKAERQALKAKKLKYYQDFSSFFSDDEELTSLPTEEPQLRKVSVSNSGMLGY